MSNEAVSTVFLAVPGTQDTRELDLDSVRNAVACGEITLDTWAWSPARNEWVPLAQLPEFAAPAPAEPARIVPVHPVAVPVKAAVNVAATPVRAAAAAAQPSVRSAATDRGGHAATYYSKPMEEHNEFPIFKILFVVLGLLIAALVGVNYFLVDQPFQKNFSKTAFGKVQAYAHLAAFVQPNVLLIHVMPSDQVNSDNFADLLTALTQSAPRQAIAGKQFSTISLTSAWRGQYAIPAEDWETFADMSGFTPEQKREFVLNHLERINGAPLIENYRNDTPEKRQAREDQVWKQLVSQFQKA
jgi:hypothetical protein